MGCAASQPSHSDGSPLDGAKGSQHQASSTHAEFSKLGAGASLPAAAVEPRHEAPVPAQLAESQAAAIAEAQFQKRRYTDTALLSANKKSPNNSRTTVARPPWGATPSAAVAVIRRKDARSLRLSSPVVALKTAHAKTGSPGGTPPGVRAGALVANTGSAGAAPLSSRRRANRHDGTGPDVKTPGYLQATAAAAAKMSKTPTSGPLDKRQPWGMRKLSPIKRTLAYPGGAPPDNMPAVISIITATEEPPHPTMLLGSVDSHVRQGGEVAECATQQDTPAQVLGALEAEHAAEAEPDGAASALNVVDAAQPPAAVVPPVTVNGGMDIPHKEPVGVKDGGAEPLAAVEKVPEPQIDDPVKAAPVPDAVPALAESLAAESDKVGVEMPALSA